MKTLKRWMKGKMLRHMHGMITCEQFEGFILQYLDDELAAPQRLLFEKHLKWCRECRDYLASYDNARAVGAAVFKSEDGTLPSEIPEDLIKAVIESRKK